jgi:hypothetical protein
MFSRGPFKLGIRPSAYMSENLSCLFASLRITSAAKSTSSSFVSGPTLNLNVLTACSGGKSMAYRIEEYGVVLLDDE